MARIDSMERVLTDEADASVGFGEEVINGLSGWRGLTRWSGC
jgi:hypothetical protein